MSKTKKDYTHTVKDLFDGKADSLSYENATQIMQRLGCKDISRERHRSARSYESSAADFYQVPSLGSHSLMTVPHHGFKPDNIHAFIGDLKRVAEAMGQDFWDRLASRNSHIETPSDTWVDQASARNVEIGNGQHSL